MRSMFAYVQETKHGITGELRPKKEGNKQTKGRPIKQNQINPCKNICCGTEASRRPSPCRCAEAAGHMTSTSDDTTFSGLCL